MIFGSSVFIGIILFYLLLGMVIENLSPYSFEDLKMEASFVLNSLLDSNLTLMGIFDDSVNSQISRDCECCSLNVFGENLSVGERKFGDRSSLSRACARALSSLCRGMSSLIHDVVEVI